VKKAAIMLPATYPDAMQPGEYSKSKDGTHVACPACGVCQRLEAELFSCTNPSCDVSIWIELAGAN
jgi:hypothetical protein